MKEKWKCRKCGTVVDGQPPDKCKECKKEKLDLWLSMFDKIEPMDITPVAANSGIYNAADKNGKGRGSIVGKNGRIVKSANCCLKYSVIRIDEEYAVCQSWDKFGKLFEERILLRNLEPYSEKR